MNYTKLFKWAITNNYDGITKSKFLDKFYYSDDENIFITLPDFRPSTEILIYAIILDDSIDLVEDFKNNSLLIFKGDACVHEGEWNDDVELLFLDIEEKREAHKEEVAETKKRIQKEKEEALKQKAKEFEEGIYPEPLPLITSVTMVDSINVEYGTSLESLGLPETVVVDLDNGDTQDLSVSWDEGTPTYDKNNSRVYDFKGSLQLTEDIRNTSKLKAEAKVTVDKKVLPNLESVATIADIEVDYGTKKSNIGLPTTIQATMDNESDKELTINWDNGTPVYDGDTAGSYLFKGTLTTGDEYTNNKNVVAEVKVIVEAKPEPEEPDPEPEE